MDTFRKKNMLVISAGMGNKFRNFNTKSFLGGKSVSKVKFHVNNSKAFKKRFLKGDVSLSDNTSDNEEKTRKLTSRKKKKLNNDELEQPSTSDSVRRSTRNKPKVIYTEISDKIEDDSYLFCYKCNDNYLDGCAEHPVDWVFNKNIRCQFSKHKIHDLFLDYIDLSMEPIKCNCKKNPEVHIKTTLPDGMILKESKIPAAGLGIWTTHPIDIGTTFGPYIGEVGFINEVKDTEFFEKSLNGYSWLVRENIYGIKTHLVDASTCLKSNWLRYINCARNDVEQNLVSVQYNGRIFYRACQNIEANQELLTYYGLDFAKDLGISTVKIRCRQERPEQMANNDNEDSSSESCSSSEYTSDDDDEEEESSLDEEIEEDIDVTNNTNITRVESQLCSDTCDLSIKRDKSACSYKSTDLNLETIKLISNTIKEDATLSCQSIHNMIIEKYNENIELSSIEKFMNINGLCQTKITKSMEQYMKECIAKYNVCKVPEMRKLLLAVFPNCQLSNDQIKNFLVRNNPECKRSYASWIDDEVIGFIKQLIDCDSKIKLDAIRDQLHLRYPDQKMLAKGTISRLILDNKIRSDSLIKVDDEMIEFIRNIIKSNPNIGRKSINENMRNSLPNKPQINDSSISNIINKYNIRDNSIGTKVDNEMIEFIRNIIKSIPNIGRKSINENMRNSLPNKPQINDSSISKLINKYNIRYI